MEKSYNSISSTIILCQGFIFDNHSLSRLHLRQSLGYDDNVDDNDDNVDDNDDNVDDNDITSSVFLSWMTCLSSLQCLCNTSPAPVTSVTHLPRAW